MALFKAEIVAKIIEKYFVSSVIEYGCGDGNQLGLIFPKASVVKYLGLDISQAVISICKRKYKDHENKDFILIDPLYITNKNQMLQADMAISLDVVFHLVEDQVFESYMNNLFNFSRKVVVIYSSNHTNPSGAVHLRHRKFTDYVDCHFSDWLLADHIENRYPWNPEKSDTTSFADFYIFVKKGSILG